MHRLRWRKRVQLGDSLLAVASLTLAMPLAAAAPSAAQVDRPPSSVSYRIAPLEGLFDVSAFTMTGHVQRWQRMRPASIALAPVNEDEGWWPFGDIYTGKGLDGDVRSFATYQGKLIAAGHLFAFGTGSGIDWSHGVAAWDGASWSRFDAGVFDGACDDGGDLCTAVFAATVFEGDLIVAGNFRQAGDFVPRGYRVDARFIARWTGSRWSTLGEGLNAPAHALLVYGGNLIVGGDFTLAGGQPAARIARWTGESWRAIGAGFNAGVWELAEFRGDLIASGAFGYSGATPVSRIARWDGDAWQPLGDVPQGPLIRAMYVLEDELLADLVMHASGSRLSRWDGSTWTLFELTPGYIMDLLLYRGSLVACGVFTRYGHILRWDGAQWRPLGSGLSGRYGGDGANVLFEWNEGLFVGGWFEAAGGKVSTHIARWTDPTAVELRGFAATMDGDAVRLAWELSPESRFEAERILVQRASARAGPFFDCGEPLGPEPVMSFVDRTAEAGSRYWYRLVASAWDGTRTVLGALEILVPAGRPAVRLEAPVGVAGDGPIEFRYRVAGASPRIRLALYDATGKLVRSLDEGPRGPGLHVVRWDRRTPAGAPASRGVYFVKLEARGLPTQSRKLVLTSR